MFFCFKQKTAYEMRISDWSSDVCSSDLIGITRTRAQTIRTIACALLDGDVDFRVERTLDEFVARWTALPGIGPWTAHYIALRALGHPDAFPADDLVLQKAVQTEPAPAKAGGTRSEERRVGKEGVSTGRSRWWPDH